MKKPVQISMKICKVYNHYDHTAVQTL